VKQWLTASPDLPDRSWNETLSDLTFYPRLVDSVAKDFFVSYISVDKAWAMWSAYIFEADGHMVTLQEWDCRPGSNFAVEMDIVPELRPGPRPRHTNVANRAPTTTPPS
jgi:hypothetical protein